mgnify:CR=1 FL=1
MFSAAHLSLGRVFRYSARLTPTNYSKENKNEDVLKSLQFPQRFGYPVFVILNSKGELIHTQNSAYLEKGEGYSKEIVMDFFHQWRKDALDEKNYKK